MTRLCLLLATTIVLQVPAKTIEVPVLETNWWWQIAENHPDVTPWDTNTANACDFTIFRATNGMWQLIACIRSTAYPESNRLFYRWETSHVTNRMWTGKSVFATTITNAPLYQWPGVMQAPHCFANNGRYYFFYNSAYLNAQGGRQGNAAYCKISTDGIAYADHTNVAGKYEFFVMGRDMMIFRTTNNTWIAYYCGTSTMVCRMAPTLEGPWSANEIDLGAQGNPESPFVVRRGTNYYLWEQMYVYQSLDPTNFAVPRITKMTPGYVHGKYAPEVFEYDGQWYIAGYAQGIWLARMKWVTKEVTAADVVWLAASGMTLAPVFDSTQTVYSASVAATVTNTTVLFIQSEIDASAAVSNGTWGVGNGGLYYETNGYKKCVVPLTAGENNVTVTITGTAGSLVTKTYKLAIQVLPEPGLCSLNGSACLWLSRRQILRYGMSCHNKK